MRNGISTIETIFEAILNHEKEVKVIKLEYIVDGIFWGIMVITVLWLSAKIKKQWINDNTRLKKKSIEKLYSIKSMGEGMEKILNALYIPNAFFIVQQLVDQQKGIIVNIVAAICTGMLLILVHAKIAKCEKLIRKKERHLRYVE